MKKFYCLIAAILLITFCQAQKEKLELNLTKGETYKLNISSSSLLNVPKNGKQLKSKEVSCIKLVFKVIDFQDNKYVMEGKIDSISLTGNVFNMTIGNYFPKDGKIPDDSTNKFLKRIFTAMKGMQFKMNITKSGKAVFVNDMINDTSKVKLISNIFIMGIIKSIPVFYPDSAVAKGDKWNVTSAKTPKYFEAEELYYTLKEVTDNYILITGSANTTTNINNPKPINGQPVGVLDMTVISSTDIKIDRKTGWIIDAKMSKSIKSTVKADPKKPGDKDSQIDGVT